MGAGRTALCRPLPDSTLSLPGHVREVEVQEHNDNVFEVRIGRDGLSCGPGVQLNTSWSPQEVIMELQKYGEIEEMNVCDNLGDHLVGNVYVSMCLLSPHWRPEVEAFQCLKVTT